MSRRCSHAVALLLPLLLPGGLLAQEFSTGSEIEVLEDRAEVKSGTTVIATAGVGDRFQVLRTFDKWVRVSAGGREGWIERTRVGAVPRYEIGTLLRPLGSVALDRGEEAPIPLGSDDELIVVRTPEDDTLTVTVGDDVGTVPANRVTRVARIGTPLADEHGERVAAFREAVKAGNVARAARLAMRIVRAKREVLARVRIERPSDRTLQTDIRRGIADFADFAGGRLRDLEELESELAMRRSSLSMWRAANGDDHWRTASARAEYRYARELADADPERHDALRAADRQHGEANRLLKEQDYLEAANRLSENLVERRRLLGDEHLQVAVSLHNLAFAHDRLNQHEKAAPLYRESAEIVAATLGKEHPEYATRVGNLGRMHLDDGEFDAAEPLLLECLGVRERALGANNGATRAVVQTLVGLYEKTGAEQQANAMRRRLKP